MNTNAVEQTHQYVSDEDAMSVVASFEDLQVYKLEGCSVYIGRHPTRGRLTAIVAAFGESLLLFPFESRSSFL